ncbi:MAG: hypothetical protein QXX79_04675 [Candidatus Bathyarchaeia archaeon]
MWFITLLIAMLFGVYLQAKKAPLTAWIIAAIATLILGWLPGLIIPAIMPELATYATASFQTYISVTILGLILGLTVGYAQGAITKT